MMMPEINPNGVKIPKQIMREKTTAILHKAFSHPIIELYTLCVDLSDLMFHSILKAFVSTINELSLKNASLFYSILRDSKWQKKSTILSFHHHANDQQNPKSGA